MKAVVRYNYGNPDNILIEEMPKPKPKPKEVLIKVKATTVNRTDCGVISGEPYIFRFFVGWPKPRTPILGTDFAGVVEEVGSQVSGFKVGDKVWGFNDNGIPSQAEYIVYKEDGNILKIPDGFGFAEAVASAEAAHYAINFLKYLKLNNDAKVLVNGATGGIGSATVQILLSKGLEVVATANTKNLDLIKGLGVTRVIDYENEDFTKLNEKFDVVFDSVGKSSFGQCKGILKEHGKYLSSELGPGSENLYLPLATKIKGGKRVIFPLPTDIKGSMTIIKELMEKGKFRPVIDRSYPMEKAAEAYRYVASGQKTGNVILDIEGGKEMFYLLP
ncbi:NADPH:quinone reductase [Aquiflexum balticum DSM 16537]|uniref:NADPH:quinone reductase n=1 Tax=Aquiflexum balticum DSM 16537 TaxID=758820 RepID=A0A1W2HBC2_9BACT|nr:NAD(P)-dependent alcohol dehydrogenase [Aquiflexum balticum]SMD46104.1 NADPH:quinone reductase [Aquiflexum balticum DSM 16537]